MRRGHRCDSTDFGGLRSAPSSLGLRLLSEADHRGSYSATASTFLESVASPGWSATFDTSGLSLGASKADHMSPDRYELSALFGSGRHRPGGVLMLSIYSLTRKPSGLGFRLCRTDHLHEPYRQTPSELCLCAQPGLHVEPGAAPQLQRPTAAHLRLRGRLPGLQRISFLSA